MTGRETAGIFKTWKEKNRNLEVPEGKNQESLSPGRENAGIFKSWKEKSRNL
jgi:viroplasmin and RNaseH domain-containing protein